MPRAYEGSYEDGVIRLKERPPGLDPGRVMVTIESTPPVDCDEASESPVDRTREREEAKARILARMKQGYHLGGGPYYTTRDELHDRDLR